MKKIVPFKKELMFKTKIGEITSIALDHTLKLDEQFIAGEFIISGTYKMLEGSELEEEFNYNIPVDITIDDKYDTKNCTISIDDFTYEIINEETLVVNISVMLDDLDIKTDPIETIKIDERNDFDMIELVPDNKSEDTTVKTELSSNTSNNSINDSTINNIDVDINTNIGNTKVENNKEFEKELFDNLDDSHEYSIYRVYTVKEDDTVDLILEKFNVTRDILKDYNDLDNLTVGSKIIIPSVDE